MVFNLEKKKSRIHGTGIFAATDISANSPFYAIPLLNLSDEARANHAHIGDSTWLGDDHILNFVNHSCRPNTLLDISDSPRLVSTKSIQQGEEITIDYNLTEKGGKRVVCDCSSVTCKGYFLKLE